MGDDRQILVVGAGVAGLACAAALSQAPGFRVTLAESYAKDEGLAGMNLAVPPNGTRALAALGLPWSELSAEATALERYEVRSAKDTLISGCSLKPLWLGEEQPYFSIPRRALLERLLSRCDKVDLRFSTRVDDVYLEEDRATVSFAGEVEHFDLVIAADGVHSALRSAHFPEEAADPIGQFSWRATVQFPEGEPLPEGQIVYSGNGRTFLLIPQGQRRVYLYAAIVSDSLREDELVPRRGKLSRVEYLTLLFAQFQGFVPRALRLLSEQDLESEIHAAPLFECHPSTWSSGHRLVLIGDAAHGCSPSIAQGAALAAEDAVVLAECLTQWAPDDSPAPFLKSYEARRRPRTDHVKIQARARDTILKKKAASPFLALAMDQVLRFRGLKRLQEDGFRILVDEKP